MLFAKGTIIQTNNAIWKVSETQNTNKYLKVVSKDGFLTVIDIKNEKIKIY